MSNSLLKIRNHHSVSCGGPPTIDDNRATYLGYFVGKCGDQWVFTYNRRTKSGELRGGDAGWNQSYVVIDGMAPELILAADESAWLIACWGAATGESLL